MLDVEVITTTHEYSILGVTTPSGREIAVEFSPTSLCTFDTHDALKIYYECNMMPQGSE